MNSDGERAAIAVAYRLAADMICPARPAKWSRKLQPVAAAARAVSEVNRDVILSLTPADAEAKLREIVERAVSIALGVPRGKTVLPMDIVDEVLNESGSGVNGGKK